MEVKVWMDCWILAWACSRSKNVDSSFCRGVFSSILLSLEGGIRTLVASSKLSIMFLVPKGRCVVSVWAQKKV